MKLVQSNIWGGKLEFQLLDFFADQQADIACLQEVNDLKGPSGALFATFDEILEIGNFSDSHMAALHSSNYMNRTLHYGNATASKFPIVERHTIFTYGDYKDNFDMVDDETNVRNLQHIVVDVSGKNLHVLNHHGFFIAGSKAGDDETLRQMHMIANYIKQLDGPVILSGDFNLAPNSESMQVFNDLLTDLSSKFGLTSTYAHLSIHNVVCDYILVNNQVTVNNFQMSDDLISDHKALILDFDL
ncbi:MAG: hypothetical protein JWO35_199 [Candidatus Saccharibacteria bacterium]|nr:hypothetical protein [Candidatus Saccharibacteria bacterium]